MLHVLVALPHLTYPGLPHHRPLVHFVPHYVSDEGGWHDVAGAFTHKNGVHHIFMGTGWNHATSTDLVRWSHASHGPRKIVETYAGMRSYSDPCSGFVTLDKDGDGKVCAGFRQCASTRGVDGGASWDVPLELRCALDDNLTTWNDASPEYLFNVSWYRGLPYDPARPWKEADGNWYVMLSMDGCNETTRRLPCASGGQLGMWKSPALRGPKAAWARVGPVFTTNATALKGGHLTHEFVTIDYIGHLPGDPKPEGLGTRLFLNNVGGNGGGVGCCSGTTSYFPVTQAAPGGALESVAPQGMVDWGAFKLKLPLTSGSSGLDLLDGTGSRGLSMARTLGSPEPDQVTLPGRRVLIGWAGPSDKWPNLGSAQSLPRELSLAPDRTLLQQFVPELKALRQGSSVAASGRDAWFPRQTSLQVEVVASLPPSCAAPNASCGVSVLGDMFGATTVSLHAELGLVLVNAVNQGNANVRGGPLPKARDGSAAWTIHLIADHSIVEVIVNNATAFIVYAAPETPGAGLVQLVGTPADASSAKLEVWNLADPKHHYAA